MTINLKPIDRSMFKYFRGTFARFGLRSALTTVSPLLNTILNWKYRNWELKLNIGGVPVTLDKVEGIDHVE